MTEEYYKQQYNELHNKYKKLWQFIESLESSTQEWNDLCDCGFTIHQDECRTLNLRKDVEKLR